MRYLRNLLARPKAGYRGTMVSFWSLVAWKVVTTGRSLVHIFFCDGGAIAHRWNRHRYSGRPQHRRDLRSKALPCAVVKYGSFSRSNSFCSRHPTSHQRVGMVSPHSCGHSHVHVMSKFMERDLHIDRLLALCGIREGSTVHTRIAAFINEAGQIRPQITDILLHQSVVVWASKFPTNWGHVQPISILGRLPEKSGVMKP